MNSRSADLSRAEASAVSLERLRRLTLQRATATYTHWVERSVGWGTLVWMVFWLVFYAVAASQVVIFNVKPSVNSALPIISSLLVAAVVAYVTLTRRTPPVILNRQDLYRVGLAPVTPARVLAWEFAYSRGIGFFIGVLIGLIWWLMAYAFFRLEPIYAPLALGLWFVAVLDWGWLQYTGWSRIWVLPALLLVGVAGDLVFSIGGSSALLSANPLGLVLPAVAAILGGVWSRVSLTSTYPPLFATHSLILSQLRAMNLTMVMVQRPPDPDVRRRLVQTLRSGSPALRPTRFLPIPRAAGPIGAIAWRVALTLYRRSILEQLGVVFQLAVLIAASTSTIEGVVGKLLLMLALSVAVPRLLGPVFGNLPVDTVTRTLGRILPGIAIIAVLTGLAFVAQGLISGVSSAVILTSALHSLIALVALEKLSTRFKTPPTSRDVALLSAFIAVLPEVTLGILGVKGSLLEVQLGLLVLMLWQPFL